jgi:PAS domain S-box-containing protein
MKPAWRIALGGICYAIAYILCTTYSLNPPLATVWLCSGVTLFVLLRLPIRLWWLTLSLYAVINFVITIFHSQFPLQFALLSTASNTIEPLMAGMIIYKLIGRQVDISHLHHVLMMCLAIWTATIITALTGAYGVWLLSDSQPYWINMTRWAVSGGLGATLVVWTMLAWTTPQCRRDHTWPQLFERMGALLINILLTWVLYHFDTQTILPGLPEAQFRIPLLLWVVMRFGPRMVSLFEFISVTLILYATSRGHGPFADPNVAKQLIEISMLTHMSISITAILLLCSVITDRSRVASERQAIINDLRRTRQSLETLIESSPLPILMLNSKNHVQIWNKAAEKVFGWKAQEVTGIHIPTIPNDRKEQHKQFADHVRNGGALNGVQIKRWRKNGTLVDVQTYVAPLMSHTMQYEGCVVVYVDMTETLRVEREANQLRKLLQSMIDSMPSVLAGVDMEGNVTHWNLQASKLTGQTAEQVLGQNVAVALPMLESHIGAIQSAIEKNDIVRDRRVTWITDDKSIMLELTVYPLTDETMQGVVVRLDDITDQIRLTETVIQSEKMMSVGGLAAGMAHEINNPLAGMMQCAQVIENRLIGDLPANKRAAEAAGTNMSTIQAYALARELPDLLQDINETGARAARIVDNMLRYARKDEGQYRRTDINSLVDKTLEIARNDYDLRKRYDFQAIQLVRDYSDTLPLVQCQETEIQQVILNLVKNAAEAMWMHREEMGQPHLFLRTSQIGDDVLIEVEDNGPGIEKAVCRRLFEPFFTTKPAGVGTGLGLAVSSYIVSNNHGGSLEVFSEVGHGARFVVKLPQSAKVSKA